MPVGRCQERCRGDDGRAANRRGLPARQTAGKAKAKGAVLIAKEPAKRGPKPLHGENMQAFHFRMTKAQREKLDRLGGAAWVREQIDKAK